MSKREVLRDIYPDELEAIYAEMREAECKRYMGYYNELVAGMIGHTRENDRSVEEYMEKIVKEIRELSSSPDAPDAGEIEPDDPEVIKEKLQSFIGKRGVEGG